LATHDGVRLRAESWERSGSDYWEERAVRFAREGQGRAAVCSFGMPEYHNRAIDFGQQLALRKWLRLASRGTVLDVGCGVGRWSRRLASHGGHVTGVDLSPTMVAEAERRTAIAGLSKRCRFQVGDVTRLDLRERFDTVWCVTVLQHLIDQTELLGAVRGLFRHLAPDGRLIVLEAAPSRPWSRCDSPVFTARPAAEYVATFQRCGLRCLSVAGVDPSGLRVRLLPYYRALAPVLGNIALAAATIVALPIDVLLGRLLVQASWHKVFVLARETG
jgi:2-polyprenyl-3-methyl-5-hydroxy-6-metoxy-1,4-benzoquinol methylase